jgi:hypothetical protein
MAQQKQRRDRMELRLLKKRAARYDHFLSQRTVEPQQEVRQWDSIVAKLNLSEMLERMAAGQ